MYGGRRAGGPKAAAWNRRWVAQSPGCATTRSPSGLPNLAGFCRDSGGIRNKSSNSGSYTPPAPRVHHITNVEEDGTIPAGSKPNWSTPGLNNFRQNKQPDSEFGAPDAIVAIEPLCPDRDTYTLVATVRNVGEAALPAGVVVGFYTGDPPGGTKVGEGVTSKPLYPLESEVVSLPFDAAPMDVKDGTTNIYAVVDDTAVPHPSWQECRTDNNIGTSTGKCVEAN